MPNDKIAEPVSPQEAQKIIAENFSNHDFTIIDVRTPSEFAGGHLEKAVNIDLFSPTFKNSLGALSKSGTYLVYCHTGNRGASAMRTMASLGFERVYNILGGIAAWQNAGLPVTK